MHTIGVGLIKEDTIEYFKDKAEDRVGAMKMSIREYLAYYLDYDQEVLEDLIIKDVWKSAKEDVIYFALQNKDINLFT